MGSHVIYGEIGHGNLELDWSHDKICTISTTFAHIILKVIWKH